jgi:hypothetical protein
MAEDRQPRRRRRRSTREPPERLPWLRYDRMARAVTERLRVRPVPGQPFWVLTVRNPVHHTHYQVVLPEYPADEAVFCSCPDFARKGIGTCKHVEAAFSWLEVHPDLAAPAAAPRGVSAVWRAVDAAQEASQAEGPPATVRLRLAGRALFETRTSSSGKGPKKREGGKGSVESTGASGA